MSSEVGCKCYVNQQKLVHYSHMAIDKFLFLPFFHSPRKIFKCKSSECSYTYWPWVPMRVGALFATRPPWVPMRAGALFATRPPWVPMRAGALFTWGQEGYKQLVSQASRIFLFFRWEEREGEKNISGHSGQLPVDTRTNVWGSNLIGPF